MRWRCLDCKGKGIDLCTTCYMMDEHNKRHLFQRIDHPGLQGTPVGVRISNEKIQAMGIYRGAKVMRGPDWMWGDQDDGNGQEGVVQKITDWHGTPSSAAVVSWDFSEKSIYRLGYQGKVDLKCTIAAVGGCYYKWHLPVLGNQLRPLQSVPREPEKSSENVDKLRASDNKAEGPDSEPGNQGTHEDGNNNHVRQINTDADEIGLSVSAANEEHGHEYPSKDNPPSLPSSPSSPVHNDGANSTGSPTSNTAKFLTKKCELSAIQQKMQAKRAKASSGPLHKAAVRGDFKTVQKLINSGQDVDQRDMFDLTPLHLAAWYGRGDVVKLLLEHGADVNAIDRFQKTALQKARRHNHSTIIELLLKKNATERGKQPLSLRSLSAMALVATDRKSGFNLLQAAALQGDRETVIAASRFLGNSFVKNMEVESTANNAKVMPGRTAFDILSGRNDQGHRKIKASYQVISGDIKTYNELHQSVLNEDSEMVLELVLENNVDINTSSKRQCSPLFVASPSCNSVLIKALTDLGADPNRFRDDKLTPLELAVSWNNYIAVQLLLQNGADATVHKWNESVIIYHCLARGFFTLAKRLLELGCDVNEKDEDGETSLHWAAREGNKRVVKFLLENGAVVNVHNKQTVSGGRYCIVRGRRNGRPTWWCFLVDKNYLGIFLKKDVADLERFGVILKAGLGENPPESTREELGKEMNAAIEGTHNMTPLHLACSKTDDMEIIDLLIKYGADVNALDADGYTALHLAAIVGKLSVVRKLVELKADINMSTPDGTDAVHLAALNKEPEIEDYLKSQRGELSPK